MAWPWYCYFADCHSFICEPDPVCANLHGIANSRNLTEPAQPQLQVLAVNQSWSPPQPPLRDAADHQQWLLTAHAMPWLCDIYALTYMQLAQSR